METTQEERRKLINDAFIERTRQIQSNTYTSLGQPTQEEFKRVNEMIAEKKNTLQTRYNELRDVEERLKEFGLHNHYY